MELVEIRNLVMELGSDRVSVFGGSYEGGIHLQQAPEEVASLLCAIQGFGIESMLEIGSAAGGNVYLFNEVLGLKNIVIIDDNRHKKHELRKETLSKILHIEFIGDSHSQKAVDFVSSLGVCFDMLFIDGDHSYDGVKMDTEMYSSFVNDGGFVIYHDSSRVKDVKEYCNEIRQGNSLGLEYFDEYIQDKRGFGLLVMRKVTEGNICL